MRFVLIFLIVAAVGLTGFRSDAAPEVPLRFAFGPGPYPDGVTAVRDTGGYDAARGFGFEPGADCQFAGGAVVGLKPFAFSIRLPEGNHEVTLTLGDDEADSVTTVRAEARRLLLENQQAAKGKPVARRMTVNTRTPVIGDGVSVKLKQRERESEGVTWDERLTLEFSGLRASLRAIDIKPIPGVPTVFIAGDSTVCDQPDAPWNSWGQMLPRFLKPGVAVANYAQSGESLKSSIGARRFEKIFSTMKRGDTLLLQFGHNDMKDKSPDALDTYTETLRKLVAETRAKGGVPVLVTSMERKSGVKNPTLAGYPDAVRKVAREEKVGLVDLNAASVRLYQALGADLGLAFQDGTHHNGYGSYELAKCVAADLVSAQPALAAFVTDEARAFSPDRPDPPHAFALAAESPPDSAKPDGD